MNRREFVSCVGAVVTGAAASARVTGLQKSSFVPDVEIELRAAVGTAPVLPGPATRVWRYEARLLKGAPATIASLPDSYLGPVLRWRTGQRVRVHFLNDLPEPSIVHWHGLDVPQEADGHPRLAVGPGQRYVYEFEVTNRAGTYWYHPHPHMRTAHQVYHGLAGIILVSDPVESALNLPDGDDDLICVIQDRQFGNDNQLVYLSGMPMDNMNGFLGSRMLVNGRPSASRSLATRAYRLRLMNGSNARVYKLGWDPATPMTVIGTDGGLLERPVQRPYVTLAPGERVDTILDLREAPIGHRLVLRSLEFPSELFTMTMGSGRMGGGMRGGMGGGGGDRRGRTGMGRGAAGETLPQGARFDVMTVTVDRRERSAFVLPPRLSSFDRTWQPPASVPTRVVKLDFRHMRFLLDGREFDMQEVTSAETVKAGSTHIWELDNSGPTMMNVRLGHPLHLHGRQYRVLKRQVEPARRAGWDTLREGFVDEGWKDTVLVLPGERVQVLVTFSSHPGLYLYHCHNLEHEDMGMMRNFKIV